MCRNRELHNMYISHTGTCPNCIAIELPHVPDVNGSVESESGH